MRSRLSFKWTEEAMAQLREMVESGQFSASQIAERLSPKDGSPLTRSAVLGKMHRLRLSSYLTRADNDQGIRLVARTVISSSGTGSADAPRRFLPPQKAFFKQSKIPFARSLAPRDASSTATDTAPSLPQPVQTGEVGDRSASPDISSPPSLPVVFRPPVGILQVKGCRAAVGVDADVIGRWLFCDQDLVKGSSYCHHHHTSLSVPSVRPPGVPTDNQTRRREGPAVERVKPLDEMIGGR